MWMLIKRGFIYILSTKRESTKMQSNYIQDLLFHAIKRYSVLIIIANNSAK
jgi:hypothetical protein